MARAARGVRAEGFGTHWKLLNTSKTLARARVVESVGGWRGGGGGGEGWAHIGSL